MTRGRKPLPQAKREKIELRVTPEEKALIRRAADRFNLSVSAYLLGLAFSATPAKPDGADNRR